MTENKKLNLLKNKEFVKKLTRRHDKKIFYEKSQKNKVIL